MLFIFPFPNISTYFAFLILWDPMELLTNTYVAFFLIVALGIALGKVSVKGISLDLSAVIFVALVFGHFGIKMPEIFQKLGLILFMFSVGIQAGPGFF